MCLWSTVELILRMELNFEATPEIRKNKFSFVCVSNVVCMET